jgi:hypothetical protein
MGGIRETLGTVVAVAIAATGIAFTRAPAAATVQHVKETSDVYVLPPTEYLGLLSLGYRAALADGLWAQVLVSQGLHMAAHRRFTNLTHLIDAINELDPEFRPPYLMADALFTFQSGETPHEEVLKAREVLERGTRVRPLDGEIWLNAGEFTAFIAPGSYLKEPAEQASWRTDGARMLARAAELGAENADVSWRALGGAGIFMRAGERDAAIRLLQRTLAVTDDEELREKIQGQLAKLLGEEMAAAYRSRNRAFHEIWGRDLTFVSKTRLLLLGPPPDPARCAGGSHRDEPRCATTWRTWAERQGSRRDD